MHASYISVKVTMKENDVQFRKEMNEARRINHAVTNVVQTVRSRFTNLVSQRKTHAN